MNDKIKTVINERRKYSVGELTDLLISGNLRREIGLGKDAFALFLCIDRASLRRIEGLETTPSMRTVLNTAAALKIGVEFPVCMPVKKKSVRPRGASEGKNEEGENTGSDPK